MTDLRQAAQQALEALIDAANVLSAPMFADAVDALKAALEQQAELEAYDKTAMNSFVQNLYDEKMQKGKHGHYETMFHVVHEAVKRFAPPQQQAEPKYIVQSNGRHSPLLTHMMTKRTTPAQAEPPPEWESIKNILDEYGLDAISFVAEWKVAQQRAEPVAQRPWVGLTDEDWEQIHDRKDTALDTFAQGAVWAAARLKERNT